MKKFFVLLIASFFIFGVSSRVLSDTSGPPYVSVWSLPFQYNNYSILPYYPYIGPLVPITYTNGVAWDIPAGPYGASQSSGQLGYRYCSDGQLTVTCYSDNAAGFNDLCYFCCQNDTTFDLAGYYSDTAPIPSISVVSPGREVGPKWAFCSKNVTDHRVAAWAHKFFIFCWPYRIFSGIGRWKAVNSERELTVNAFQEFRARCKT